MLKKAEVAVRELGLQLQFVEVRDPADVDTAFSEMVRARVGALTVLGSAMLFGERGRLVDMAAKNRMPAVYTSSEFVAAGGLMSYGANVADVFRRAATYVDKILKGTKPGAHPVWRPALPGLAANVTGLSLLAPELSGKRLQLLQEVHPKATRVAIIWKANNVAAARYLAESRSAARSLGLQIQSVEVREPSDLDAAFAAIVAARPTALMTLPDGMLLANATRIVEFAVRTRVPALFPDQEFAAAGGLIAYGPSLAANFRLPATFVVKILKGAKPADLPIEQPTTFSLVINVKTAKAMEFTIPPSLLARADQVIE